MRAAQNDRIQSARCAILNRFAINAHVITLRLRSMAFLGFVGLRGGNGEDEVAGIGR